MGTKTATPARGSKLTISLGLVNVGVKYAPLVQEQRTRGHYVDPADSGPVTQQYVNAKGAVVKPVTAYDHPTGPVVLEDADRETLKSERDGRLELKALVEFGYVEPIRFEKSYVVWPDKGHEAGYDLICDVLHETGKALIGTAVLASGRTASTKTVLITYAMYPGSGDSGCLIAHVLTYDANVTWNDINLVIQGRGDRPVSDPKLVETALTLLGGLPEEFDFSAITDEYDARLRAAIEAKADGRPMPESDKLEHAEVLDLMDALTASVEAAKGKATPKRKTSRKKAAA